MGLDVYLEHCADPASADRIEADYEAKSEAAFKALGEWEKLTDEQKNAHWDAMKALRAEVGIDNESHRAAIRERVWVDSAIDPAHLFKVGYLRSSYNSGGFNSLMKKLGLPTLYDIFEPTDDYRFAPDWNAALGRCKDALSRYEAHLAMPVGKYGVMEFSPMFQFGVESEAAALELFQKTVPDRESPPFGGGGWSNRDGEFFPDGMKVCAFITKTYTPDETGNPLASILNRPSIFAVYEKEATDEPDWYLTALQITLEMIEYVLAQPDSQHFYLVWSS